MANGSKGTGQKPFVEKETLTSLMDRVVDDFIKAELSGNNPTLVPQIIDRKLLPALRNAIDVRNRTADKNDQWRKPYTLLPAHIARIMCIVDNVRLIAFAESYEVKDCVLAMYQHDGVKKGLYDTDKERIMLHIAKYSSMLNQNAKKDVYACLCEQAPIVERCSDPDLIPVNNGIFNYKTKQLMPFSPEYVFVSKSNVDYNPNAQNVFITMPDGKVWDCDWQIKQLSGGDQELEQLIYEMMSAVLRPNVAWDKAVFLYSTKGNNGKGTVVSVLRNLLGKGSWASIQLKDMNQDFKIAPLLHSQAILVDENDVGTVIENAGNFKAIITGDGFAINEKYKPVVSMCFKGLVVECLNEFPRIKDTSPSMMRRLLIVPFNVNFTGKQRKYIKGDYLKRKDVLEYYLKQALEGDFYELSEPKVCKEAKSAYQTANDTVVEFWEDVKGELVWNLQPLGWLYALYLKWFEVNHPKSKVTPIPSLAFRSKLVEIATESGDWVCPGLDVRRNPGKKLSMAEPELLIDQYHVESFMNQTYRGIDIQKKCTTRPAASYKGVLIRKGFE